MVMHLPQSVLKLSLRSERGLVAQDSSQALDQPPTPHLGIDPRMGCLGVEELGAVWLKRVCQGMKVQAAQALNSPIPSGLDASPGGIKTANSSLANALAEPLAANTLTDALLEETQAEAQEETQEETQTHGFGRWVNQWLQWTGILLSLPCGTGLVAYHSMTQAAAPRTCPRGVVPASDLEELRCLATKMASGKERSLAAGLRQLQQWSPESPLHPLAQRMLSDWQVVAWSQIQGSFERGDWSAMDTLLDALPADDESLPSTQQIQEWQAIRDRGETLHRKAQAAIAAQNWEEARRQAQHLAQLGNDYWRQQGLKTLPAKIEQQAQAPSSEDRRQAQRSGERELLQGAALALSQTDRHRRQPSLAQSAQVEHDRWVSLASPSAIQPEFSTERAFNRASV